MEEKMYPSPTIVSRINRVARVLLIVAVLNFAAFWVGSLILGGSANAGKVENGRCYVGDHGNFTEVSREAFLYSQIHSVSVWITHPLAGIAGMVLVLSKISLSTRPLS